jgi:hypothetical protein
MPDFSYQALLNGMMPQAPPSQTPLMDGLQGMSPLAMMQAKQFAERLSNIGPRDINPGVSWGGRDRNALYPGDVATSLKFGVPENI